jgi:hypothetical protein
MIKGEELSDDEVIFRMKEVAKLKELTYLNDIFKHVGFSRDVFYKRKLNETDQGKEIEQIIIQNIENHTSHLAEKWRNRGDLPAEKSWLMLQGSKEVYLRITGKAFQEEVIDERSVINEVVISNKDEQGEEIDI